MLHSIDGPTCRGFILDGLRHGLWVEVMPSGAVRASLWERGRLLVELRPDQRGGECNDNGNDDTGGCQ